MRISTSQIYEQGVNSILNNQAQLQRTQQQVSTGQRMLTPADDPVAAAQVIDLNQAISMNAQYGQNRKTAADTMSLVENTLGQVSDTLQNVRTLAINAGNATLKDSDRATLATQLAGALSELMGSANATDAQGHFLFSGFQSTTQSFTQGPGGVQYNGDDGQRLIQVDTARQMGVSASGADVFARIPSGNGSFVTAATAGNTGTGLVNPGSVTNPANLTGHNYSINFSNASGSTTYDVVDSTTGTTLLSAQPYKSGGSVRVDGMDIVIEGAPANGDRFTVAPSSSQSLFKTVQDLVDLLNTPTTPPGGSTALANGLKQALSNIDQGLNNVLTQRGILGAKMKEIDSLNSAGDNRGVEYQKTLSTLQNIDLNEAISNLTQQQLNLQAAQKSYAQIAGMSLFSYLP